MPGLWLFAVWCLAKTVHGARRDGLEAGKLKAFLTRSRQFAASV
jgi:hypothetical protein